MKLRDIDGGVAFLAVVCGLYLLVYGFNPAIVIESLGYFANLIVTMMPVFVFVFGIMLATNIFLNENKIKRYLGAKSGLKGWFIAIVGGIISTGPIYMWFPLLSDLKERGMKSSLASVFLFNRAIKIPLIPMMILYFGWIFTTCLTIMMVIFSVIGGFIVGRIVNDKEKINERKREVKK